MEVLSPSIRTESASDNDSCSDFGVNSFSSDLGISLEHISNWSCSSLPSTDRRVAGEWQCPQMADHTTNVPAGSRRRPRSGRFEHTDPLDAQSIRSDQPAGPVLVMPQVRLPEYHRSTSDHRGFGKLRILITGQPNSGKSTLAQELIDRNGEVTRTEESSVERYHGMRCAHHHAIAGQDTKHDETTPETGSDGGVSANGKISQDQSAVTIVDCSMDEAVAISDEARMIYAPWSDDRVHYITRYLHSQFTKPKSPSEQNEESSGCIDCVLYTFSSRANPSDIRALRQIGQYTNVIPVITKSDRHTADSIKALKRTILSTMEASDVPLFLFGKKAGFLRARLEDKDSQVDLPLATSCRMSPGLECDASVLMRDDYKHPLIESELEQLMVVLFESEHAAWLRHETRIKQAQWVRRHGGGDPEQPAVPGTLIRMPRPDESGSSSTDPSQGEYEIPEFITKPSRDLRMARWARDARRSHHTRTSRGQLLRREDLRSAHGHHHQLPHQRVVSSGSSSSSSSPAPYPGGSRRCWARIWKFPPIQSSCRDISPPDTCGKDIGPCCTYGYYGRLNALDPLGIIAFTQNLRQRIRRTWSWTMEVSVGMGLVYIAYITMREI